MASKNTTTLHIRLPEDVRTKLNEVADGKGLEPATMARTVLCEHFRLPLKNK